MEEVHLDCLTDMLQASCKLISNDQNRQLYGIIVIL